jgi:ribosome-binding ATPase YchF (GTP1/OBG family)
MYGLNKKTGGKNLDTNNPDEFKKITDEITQSGSEFVVIDAKTEHDLSEFEGDDKQMMKEDLEHTDDGIDELIYKAYELLGLMTYFTTGETETRAWTVKKDSTAPQAGAAIHTDFEKKFIRAEIISCHDLLHSGSFSQARSKGLLRTEGKEYVVKDGDVIEFRV